jgi:hypothetical protein
MLKYIYRATFCVILFCISAPIARVVTISGTVTDTILETGNGKDPVLKIVPVEACSVSIVAGCNEQQPWDKYFATTDKNGRYSLTINLPETCTFKRYYFTINGKTSTTTTIPIGTILTPVDSISDTLIRDLKAQHPLLDTISSDSYSYRFEVLSKPIIRGGDILPFQYKMTRLVGTPDTLHFNKCQYRMLLLTTSKDTVYDTSFNCHDSAFTIIIPKNGTIGDLNYIPLPKDLQKTNSTFALDRKLTLIFKFFNYDVSYTTSFNVIDTDISLENPTAIYNQKKIHFNNSIPLLSTIANKLHLSIIKPGIYSIDLFTLDGRMQQSIAKNQYFSTGENVYDICNIATNSSKMLIAKIQGNGISSTAIVNKL